MRKNFIQEMIESLTDDQLRQCYNEIVNYNEKGMMGDTLVRQIRNEIANKLDDKYWDVGCSVVTIPSILMEIANRYYKEHSCNK